MTPPHHQERLVNNFSNGLQPAGNATFSNCGRYRWLLTRTLRYPSPIQRTSRRAACLFIMLNPSTADAEKNDPTIRRCVGFATEWGYGELLVANLYAYRATRPADLFAAPNPVGPENRAHLMAAVHRVVSSPAGPPGPVICAWGVHGAKRGNKYGQDRAVLAWLKKAGVTPYCLGTTKHGHPRHPLYLKKESVPVPYPSISS